MATAASLAERFVACANRDLGIYVCQFERNKRGLMRLFASQGNKLCSTHLVECEQRDSYEMVEGRSSEALGSFAQALREHRGDPAQIQAIAMDMSPALH